MAGTTAPGTLPETRAQVEPTSATASPSLPAATHTGPDAEERLSGPVAPLYLLGLVQTFSTDAALVKRIAKSVGLSRKQSLPLAAALATLRANGGEVARLQGLALSQVPGCPTIIMTMPDGRPGIGIALTDEEPAPLAEVLTACEAEAGDLEPGFVLVAIPAGVVAGGLQ
ncbi:hypothetical protein [Sphaerotilus montanus]|uniref:hypothetical protein n=1 Tax=Sphaerotilus montanus TaxID=522889 RepID=UPI003FA1BED3